jgi:hypothetical protein
MKKIVIIVFAGLLVSAGLQAQKVRIENGKVILDLTEAAGMPAGAITNVSKTAIYDNITVSNTVLTVINGHSNNTDGDINEKVFQKLEVAPKDMNNAGVIGGGGTMTMNWVVAFNGCINSDYDNGGWRLPTQRELMLILIFRDVLSDNALPVVSGDALLFSPPSDSLYKSATEFDASTAWYMSVFLGIVSYQSKTNTCRVRCVRELN